MRPETLERSRGRRNVRQSPALVTLQLPDDIEENAALWSRHYPGVWVLHPCRALCDRVGILISCNEIGSKNLPTQKVATAPPPSPSCSPTSLHSTHSRSWRCRDTATPQSAAGNRWSRGDARP